ARDDGQGERRDDHPHDRVEEPPDLQAAADRRPQAAPARHHARADAPEVGAESAARGRPRQDDRVFPRQGVLIMELFQIDDDARLFISPVIESWADVAAAGIDVVIDLEGGLDECIATDINHCLYIYFPIAADIDA